MQAKTVVELLRKRCAESSAREVAAELGVHESYISLILNNRRPPSKKIARALGYEQVRIFRPLPADER